MHLAEQAETALWLWGKLGAAVCRLKDMIRKSPGAFIFVIVGALAQTVGAQSTDPSSVVPDLSISLLNVRGSLFARQQFTVEILWKGIFFDSGQIELLHEGQVVRQYSFPPPQAPGFASRDGSTSLRMTVSLSVETDLPAGKYRVRARLKEHLSNISEPFVVEPWGLAVDGLQVGLRASPDGYAAGQPVIVTLTMRNTGAVPLCVPIPNGEHDSPHVFTEFYQKDGSALFDARPPLSRGQIADRFQILRPGELRTVPVDLHRLLIRRSEATPFADRTGTYAVGVSIYMFDRENIRCADPWRGRATSNLVRFDVKAP